MSKKFAKLLKAVLNEIGSLYPQLNQNVAIDYHRVPHFVHQIIVYLTISI